MFFALFIVVIAPGTLYVWVMKNAEEIAAEHPKLGIGMKVVATAGAIAYVIWLVVRLAIGLQTL